MINNISMKALFLAIAVSCIGSWSTYYLSIQINERLETQGYLELENIAKQVSIHYQDAIDTSLNDLQALQAFYSANQQTLTQDQFNKYMHVLDLDRRHYIQALSWVPLVEGVDRENFENKQRQYQENFNIKALNEAGKLSKSAVKIEYTPVTYISPYNTNKSAQGFDLSSNNNRRASLHYARNSGGMTTTAKIRLVQEKGDSYGFLIIAPVYKYGESTISEAERKLALLGYVTGVFRIDTLMTNARRQADKEDLVLTLLDINENDGGVLYGEVSDTESFDYDIAIPDRRWQLKVSFNKSLQESIESSPIVSWILAGGILVSLLLALSIYALQIAIGRARHISHLSTQLQRQNSELEKTVAERTKTLADKNNQLNLHVEELTEQRKELSRLMNESQSAKAIAEDRAKDLARSNRDLDEFAYVASHDLKAPLRGIDQLASWVVEDTEEGSYQDIPRNLNLIRSRVQRLEALLNDLLTYSRANKQSMELTLIDCNTMVVDSFELLSPPKEFRLTLNGELPIFSTAKSPFEQVLRNLLNNAVKHHDKSDGHIEVRCDDDEDEKFYRFIIKDNGPGIESEYFEDIFKMFKTLKPRDETEGSGMGLALIKKIVEHYEGHVYVESVLGQGSTFSFTWPKVL
ncbi:GHKL domain-containing protein [Colwellia sp. Arc7-635]|uniref:sensor histidine kinase n=1 Tax=Colwellia sp. Arc7-635 TaxID=2497879 RepID=UPI000F85555B|nr:CHASE domain-containing protein [Colwellia sp. Arc7-635]AZQ83574.1 GHKL domain-containing protein [Colwellia sp. Arc7-635]